MSEESNNGISQEDLQALLEKLAAGQPELTPEQEAAYQRKAAAYQAFVLPFVRLWWSLRLGLRGLFGVAMIPVYLVVIAVGSAFALTVGYWPFLVPIALGSYLTYTMPYTAVANTAIAFSFAVGSFLILNLALAAVQKTDDDH